MNIYFSTPTFDKVTKDEKANFESKLSVVGGTMGLLTGFSILSGIEIIYFTFKMFRQVIRKVFLHCQPQPQLEAEYKFG